MDTKLILYFTFIGVGAIFDALSAIFCGKKTGLIKKTVLMFVTLGLISGILSALIMGKMQDFVYYIFDIPFIPSRLRIFGGLLFMPIIMYFIVKSTGGDFGTVMDIFTPGTYVLLGFSKIGCASYGCCYGIPFENGVTTVFQDFKVFPIQLLESFCCFCLAFFMYLIFFKKKYRKGSLFPKAMILYGIMRFFLEYLRFYETEIEKTFFFGVGFWQGMSVICTVAGILALTVNKYHGKIPDLQTAHK